MPGADDDGFDSEATANTLRFRAVLVDPHSGHFTSSVEVIDLASFSKLFLHDLQVYS
jgi:hypothetical protein